MKEKIIVIIGGTDGLGKAIAIRLNKNNTVIISSSDRLHVLASSKEIGCKGVVCDVTNDSSIHTCITSIQNTYGIIDVLINSFGVWIQDELTANEPKKISHVIDVNLKGVISVTRAVIPGMEKQKNGEIINIISQAGLYGKAQRSVYNATKFGLVGFTKSLAMELAPKGIKVSGLYPGMMKTNMFEKVGITKNMDVAIDVEVVARAVEFIISLPNSVVVPEFGIKHIQG